MKIDLELVTEQAFKNVPGWWPRAYITLLLFKHFKETNYVAPPYLLRKRCEEYGIGKTTLYRGLNTLLNEGFVKRVNGLYVLTPEGVSLLEVLSEFEADIKELAGRLNTDELNRVKNNIIAKLENLLKRLGDKADFVKYAITYVESVVNLITTLTSELLRVAETEVRSYGTREGS